MSKLSKQRAKESFLQNVEGVLKEDALQLLNNAGGEDLYTYVVQEGAFKSGVLDDKDIGEFLLKVYSDWYFLHKNTFNNDISAVKVLSEGKFAPVNLEGDGIFDLIKMGEFSQCLPISFQYINKLEDKYFICIKTDSLYNRTYNHATYDCRLYLNIKCDRILDFAREFVDRAYMIEFPAIVKVLNNDERFDTITIYTDYEYAQIVVDLINTIRKECSYIFNKSLGKTSSMLGLINDYIGFGEEKSLDRTYLMSRCSALASLHENAGYKMLKEGVVAEEKKIIVRNDGSTYTPTEYIYYLIEKNATKLIENKIDSIEASGVEKSAELDNLYAMRDDLSIGIDMDKEVSSFKRSLTRKDKYSLEVEGLGEDVFDYEGKLYRLFSSENDRVLCRHTGMAKKDLINGHIFQTTDSFKGVNTREFLNEYFKEKLAVVIKEVIDNELTILKRGKMSGILFELKKKACTKLKSILASIIDDEDEGRVYVGRAVNDYVRILSSNALESVQISIDGRAISLDENINADIISLLPELKEDIDKMSITIEHVDKILGDFDINFDNLCLNKTSKNINKPKKVKEEKEEFRYYYNPEGYLTKDKYEYEAPAF